MFRLKIKFLWINFVVPNTKSVDPKINEQVWLPYMTTDERKEYAEDRYSSEPQKTHLIGEFVILAKFCGHVLPLGLQMWSGREAD